MLTYLIVTNKTISNYSGSNFAINGQDIDSDFGQNLIFKIVVN